MRWVKSIEQLPELTEKGISDDVLVISKNGKPYIAYLHESVLYGDFRWKLTGEYGAKSIEEVPYWAPIPPIPEQ